MRLLLNLLCVLLLLLLAPVSYTHLDVYKRQGYVNTQRLFRDAPAAVRAAKKIEQEFSKRDQDLQRLAKQVQGLQESLEKNGLTMNEPERRAKEKDLGEMSRVFQRCV